MTSTTRSRPGAVGNTTALRRSATARGIRPVHRPSGSTRHSSPAPSWAEISAYVWVNRLTIPVARRVTVRIFDVVVSVAALLALAPLLVLLTLAIACTSAGAPVYVHQRLGRWGESFPCLKFRSMYADADARLDIVLNSDPALRTEWERSFKLRKDPRVTLIGRVIRRTNLDELPQLVNVLIGQMSIVGPRPIVTAEAARYGNKLPAVLSVRPGLTGLWQTSGRSNTSYDDRTNLDLEYVVNQSLRRDLEICVRTAHQMFSPHSNGAC